MIGPIHIIVKDDAEKFLKCLTQIVNKLQDEGFIVDIQYSTVNHNYVIHYSALVIGRK